MGTNALAALAHHYEATDKHYLAAPLFLQCVSLISPQDCHAVTLMSNLAVSISQQLPPSPSTLPAGSPLLTANSAARAKGLRATQIASARAWASKAREIAQHITPPVRTVECDSGCA